jgi:hypothetical protein
MKNKNNLFKSTEHPQDNQRTKWESFKHYVENKWLDYIDALEVKYRPTTPGIPPDMFSMSANSVTACYAYLQQAHRTNQDELREYETHKP